jgi:hypothetical protein
MTSLATRTLLPASGALSVPVAATWPYQSERDSSDTHHKWSSPHILTVIAECISSARNYAFVTHIVLPYFLLLALQIFVSFVLPNCSLPCFSICSHLTSFFPHPLWRHSPILTSVQFTAVHIHSVTFSALLSLPVLTICAIYFILCALIYVHVNISACWISKYISSLDFFPKSHPDFLLGLISASLLS